MPQDDITVSPYQKQGLPHYYGDTVRNLFVAAAVLIFAALPIFPDLLPSARPFFTVLFGIALVGLAALVNPRNKGVMLVAVVFSATGGALFEMSAVGQFDIRALILPSFLIRQVIAIILLFALYFSGRTYRSMRIPGHIPV